MKPYMISLFNFILCLEKIIKTLILTHFKYLKFIYILQISLTYIFLIIKLLLRMSNLAQVQQWFHQNMFDKS